MNESALDWAASNFWPLFALLAVATLLVAIIDQLLNQRPLKDTVLIAVGGVLGSAVMVVLLAAALIAFLSLGNEH